MKSNVSSLTKWIISICLAAIITALATVYKYETVKYNMAGIVGPLCDGCFVGGFLYFGAGLMLVLTDALSFYPLQYLVYRLRYKKTSYEDAERLDFYDFGCEIKARNKRHETFPLRWMLFIIGVVIIVAGIIITNKFYVV